MSGPYFSGQQPSECGHYYPDVLRLRDEKRPDGTFVRIMDCRYCGRYELPLDVKTLDKALARKLNQKGFEIGTREDEILEVRQKALDRISRGEANKTGVLQMLHGIIDDGLRDGADSIELEYVAEGLEVTYWFGQTGVGRIIEDHELAAEIIRAIVERAKLENKSRGLMAWTYRGKAYPITVVGYETFGESAFRLRLGKSRQKRA